MAWAWAMAAVAVTLTATLPDLAQVVTRQEHGRVRRQLIAIVAHARAMALDQGTYACGRCGADAATVGDYRLYLGDEPPQDDHRGRCAQVAAVGQGTRGIRAAAIRLDTHRRRCEVWTANDAFRVERTWIDWGAGA